MCNLFANTTPQEAMRELFQAEDDLGNQPPLPGIFPDGEAPIVRHSKKHGRVLARARWGWSKAKFGWVTNIRHLDRWPWADVLGETAQRCLVPASAFSEYHPTEKDENGHKKSAWFRVTGAEARPPFAFAGLVRRWDWQRDGLRKKADAALAEDNTQTLAFAFLTCPPNGVVAPIHPKAMPVILTREEEFEQWMTGSAEDAAALQRPLPDEQLELAFIGGKEDGEG